jgi:hypothetical protein
MAMKIFPLILDCVYLTGISLLTALTTIIQLYLPNIFRLEIEV